LDLHQTSTTLLNPQAHVGGKVVEAAAAGFWEAKGTAFKNGKVAGSGADRKWWKKAAFLKCAYGVSEMKRLLPAAWDHKVKRLFVVEEMNKLEKVAEQNG
jgi:hypothetical protein